MIDCKDILILLIYGYILFQVLKPNQTTEMIVLTLVAFYLLSNSFEGLENSESLEDSERPQGPGGNDGKPGQTNVQRPSNMGKFDGLCLKTGSSDYWMKKPETAQLVDNDKLYSYLGSQGPVKMALSDQASLTGPPIDGKKGSPTKAFMWANNITSPACCPSTFSTSTGCVCTTQEQRDYVAARGIKGSETVDNEY